MFRTTSRLAQKFVKQTTGISGLDVVPNAREVLISLYERTIQVAQSYGLEGKGYNVAVVNISKDRLEVCKRSPDIPTLERDIGCGQAEELIRAAEDELELMELMNNEFKPWEWETSAMTDDLLSPPFGVGIPGGPVQVYPPPVGSKLRKMPPYPGWPEFMPQNKEDLTKIFEMMKQQDAADKAAREQAATATATTTTSSTSPNATEGGADVTKTNPSTAAVDAASKASPTPNPGGPSSGVSTPPPTKP